MDDPLFDRSIYGGNNGGKLLLRSVDFVDSLESLDAFPEIGSVCFVSDTPFFILAHSFPRGSMSRHLVFTSNDSIT